MNNEEKILDLLSGLTKKVDQIQNDVNSMKSDVNLLKSDVVSMKSDINLIKSQHKEHNETLSSLQTASEFHKADTDNLSHQVAKVLGDISTIKVAVMKGEEAYNYVQSIKGVFTTNV